MQDKTVVITGSSDGIGLAAARALKAKGANVVIIGLTKDKARAAAKELDAPYYVADFSKLSDVRELAKKLRKDLPKIDVLANNAGGVFGSRKVTEDGYELTMQVNHLAHFLLTSLLMDVLIKSKATVINTSSVANERFAKLNINDLNLEKHYSTNVAYGNAKLENILFTKELHKRYGDKGISAAAFHPGVVKTNFASGSSSWMRFVYHSPLKRLLGFISPEQGADTLVWLASTKPGTDWKRGEYFVKRKVKKANQLAYDATAQSSLWDQSEAMTAQ